MKKMLNVYLKEGTLLQGGKFRIISHLSSDGFGYTYEAVYTMSDDRVAVKSAMALRRKDRLQSVDAFLKMLDAKEQTAKKKTVYEDDETTRIDGEYGKTRLDETPSNLVFKVKGVTFEMEG